MSVNSNSERVRTPSRSRVWCGGLGHGERRAAPPPCMITSRVRATRTKSGGGQPRVITTERCNRGGIYVAGLAGRSRDRTGVDWEVGSVNQSRSLDSTGEPTSCGACIRTKWVEMKESSSRGGRVRPPGANSQPRFTSRAMGQGASSRPKAHLNKARVKSRNRLCTDFDGFFLLVSVVGCRWLLLIP